MNLPLCPCYTCKAFDPDRIDSCREQCKWLAEWEKEFNEKCLELNGEAKKE